MDKVKIKRVKRVKKKISTKEKVLAGLGLGSTLLGGAGAVSPQPKATQFVRTQETEKSTATGKIKEGLKKVFGIQKAKAMEEFYGHDDSPPQPAAPEYLDNQHGTPSPGAIVDASTNVAPGSTPLGGSATSGTVSGFNTAAVAIGGGGSAAVSGYGDDAAAQTAAVTAPSEGATKTEGGFDYVFYQGQWVLANDQIKTENGKTYITIGGQWVQRGAGLSPEGSIKIGGDGFEYTVYNGEWVLSNGQTKEEGGVTYNSNGGQWVAQQAGTGWNPATQAPTDSAATQENQTVYSPSLDFAPEGYQVGDSWTITVTGVKPGDSVYAIGGQKKADGTYPVDKTPYGPADSSGTIVISGTFTPDVAGDWRMRWTDSAGATIGATSFTVTPKPATDSASGSEPVIVGPNQFQYAAPWGTGTLDYTITDNGDGSISIMYKGRQLVQARSRADVVEALRQNYSTSSSPEGAVLGHVSVNFDNLIASSPAGGVAVDSGIRPHISLTDPVEVWRDKFGNSAAYIGPLGGRVYYNGDTGRLFQELADGSIKDITSDNAVLSPEERQNLLGIMGTSQPTSTIAIKTYEDPNYNLMLEMGVGVQKGDGYSPDRSEITPGQYHTGMGMDTNQQYQEAKRPFTLDTVTDPSGQTFYTFTTTVNGQTVTKTFVGVEELNNFLSGAVRSTTSFESLSPEDMAIFAAAIGSRIQHPEIGLGVVNLPEPNTDHGYVTVYGTPGGYTPLYLSTKEEAEYYAQFFPGCQIVDAGFPTDGNPYIVQKLDPNDPRRNFELKMPNGEQISVGMLRNSAFTSLGKTFFSDSGTADDPIWQYFKAVPGIETYASPYFMDESTAPQAANGPSIMFSAANYAVGTSWRIDFAGIKPGEKVYAIGGQKKADGTYPVDKTPYGPADSFGRITLTGKFEASQTGDWQLRWETQGGEVIKTLNFTVTAAASGSETVKNSGYYPRPANVAPGYYSEVDGQYHAINPIYFVSRERAEELARQFGGTVTETAWNNLGPYHLTDPMYNILINGNEFSAGLINDKLMRLGTVGEQEIRQEIAGYQAGSASTAAVVQGGAIAGQEGRQGENAATGKATSPLGNSTGAQETETGQTGSGSAGAAAAGNADSGKSYGGGSSGYGSYAPISYRVLGSAGAAADFQGLKMPSGYPASEGGLKMPQGYPASGRPEGLQMPQGYPASEGFVQGDATSAAKQSLGSYTVKKGDTLWLIARKHYGDGRHWRKILEANPDCLGVKGDTKTLKVGAQLAIPKL